MSDFIKNFKKLSVGDVATIKDADFPSLNDEQLAISSQFTTLSSRFNDEPQAIIELNDNLRSKTFITGNSIAKVDFVVFEKVLPLAFSWTSVDDVSKFRHIIRWIDLLQTSFIEVDQKLPIDYNLELPKEVKEKKKPVDKDGKKQEQEKPAKKSDEKSKPQSTPGAPISEEEKKLKAEAAKAKKEARAKAKAEANAKNAAANVVEAPNPGMIDFRVGFIEKAIKHPDADSLYVSTIQMGDEEGPRTVCSGLVKYIPLEEMQQRYVVVIANLKPVSMRGIKSTAMVLCASNADTVEFVNPPPNSKAGDKIFFEDFNRVPEKQLNPKKKIFEAIQPLFSTNENFEVTYTEEGKEPKKLVNEKGELCHNTSIVKADVK